MILAGDVGGTKTHLALFETERETLRVVAEHRFASREHETFDAVVSAFLAPLDAPRIDSACFGIAGPVIEGRCRTTNLPWQIDARELSGAFNIASVRLLNDLEATAYGMRFAPEEAFVDLNPEGSAMRGNCAVIAAGTGLGEAMLFFDGARYHPVGTEGGHSDFAPQTPRQDELLRWLRGRFGAHVSYERILSGPGMHTLYEFVRDLSGGESAWMRSAVPDEDLSARVSRGALEAGDPLCRDALELFVEVYGAEAGNLALKTMSLGGVYVGGGIAPKILSALRTGTFMNAFAAKGRFEPMLRAMPVRVALDPQTALFGAAHFARERL